MNIGLFPPIQFGKYGKTTISGCIHAWGAWIHTHGNMLSYAHGRMAHVQGCMRQ